MLALSPFASPFVSKETLKGITVPVMYQGGTRDRGVTPFVKRNGGAYDLTPAPAYFVEFEQAGHFAWTDLTAAFQESINFYSLAFLNKHLRGDAAADPKKKRPDVSDLRSK